jgi:hypothetical protein
MTISKMLGATMVAGALATGGAAVGISNAAASSSTTSSGSGPAEGSKSGASHLPSPAGASYQ